MRVELKLWRNNPYAIQLLGKVMKTDERTFVDDADTYVHEFVIDGLLPGERYFYELSGTDRRGSRVYVTEQNFATKENNIALGKPVETVVLEQAQTGGSIEYYRSGDGTHHVPKRSQSDVLLKLYG